MGAMNRQAGALSNLYQGEQGPWEKNGLHLELSKVFRFHALNH
jgi:hypothetical protein